VNWATTTTVTGAASPHWQTFYVWATMPPPPENPGAAACAVLGVGPQTPPGGIRAAYRAAAKATHPDVGGDVDDFRAVQGAYERLRRLGRT